MKIRAWLDLPETKAKKAAQAKAWRDRYPGRAWKNNIRLKYGITVEQFYQMLAKQDFVCGICGIERDMVRGKAPREGQYHVDHCHTTGRVRGLLCGHCNTMLGQAFDNPDTLRTAAQYLEEEV